MTRVTKTGAVVVLLAILSWGWYSVAANYSYGAVAGRYTFRLNGYESILVLNDDQTFQQELKGNGSVAHAQGSWRRVGEGGVVFSKEFLKVSGQDTRPDGQIDGEIKKHFGLFLSIVFRPDPGGPVFHRKLFR